MRIIVTKPFDYRFPSGAVMHVTPWLEPITVKREVGEAGITKGCAKEFRGKPGEKVKPVPPVEDPEPQPGSVTLGDQAPPVITSE